MRTYGRKPVGGRFTREPDHFVAPATEEQEEEESMLVEVAGPEEEPTIEDFRPSATVAKDVRDLDIYFGPEPEEPRPAAEAPDIVEKTEPYSEQGLSPEDEVRARQLEEEARRLAQEKASEVLEEMANQEQPEEPEKPADLEEDPQAYDSFASLSQEDLDKARQELEKEEDA